MTHWLGSGARRTRLPIYYSPSVHTDLCLTFVESAKRNFEVWEHLCADGLRDPQTRRGQPGFMTDEAFLQSRAQLAISQSVEVEHAIAFFASRSASAEATAAEYAEAIGAKYGLTWDLSPGATILAALEAGAWVVSVDGRGSGPETQLVFGRQGRCWSNHAYVSARQLTLETRPSSSGSQP